MSLKNEILQSLKSGKLSAGHDINHAMRVLENGFKIAKNLNLNNEVLTAALLLHDCDRSDEKKHALKSAEKAVKTLKRIGFPSSKISLVFEAIKNHSRTDLSTSQKDFYSAIVYDADKLDGVGKQAIPRVLEIQKSKNWSSEQAAEWYLGRILDVAKNEPLYLKESKKLSRSRLEESLDWCKKKLGKKFKEQLMKHGFKKKSEIRF